MKLLMHLESYAWLWIYQSLISTINNYHHLFSTISFTWRVSNNYLQGLPFFDILNMMSPHHRQLMCVVVLWWWTHVLKYYSWLFKHTNILGRETNQNMNPLLKQWKIIIFRYKPTSNTNSIPRYIIVVAFPAIPCTARKHMIFIPTCIECLGSSTQFSSPDSIWCGFEPCFVTPGSIQQ